ncbi:phosphotransferase family protein [Lederbergia citri]|uniref:Phosphotransferase family protein n=1 Tax=Lederbergia citri TaxID=2833580 RepID=A0A942TE24_9BACI|nr:phosphotransferase family protein [Lederbergia citri]MBS4195076.1 phosphotransferase family protein [Lederbergia citri]
MDFSLGQDWEITPAGGATGEAFFAKKDNKKLFLKRNSSPFLAVLSAEGIVPKLIWTKRMENGDVITAQQYLIGREFTPNEMADKRAAKLLKKIHDSQPLLMMLTRMGKTPFGPYQMLDEVDSTLDQAIQNVKLVKDAHAFLNKEVLNIECNEWAVCHGDVNHNNWLISDKNKIYLIDWDGAMIADPAMDLGLLLHWYIPKTDWEKWLEQYGKPLTDELKIRMKWYTIAHTLLSIQWHKNKNRFREMEYWLNYLDHFNYE